MDTTQIRVFGAALFCIFIFLTGFWLRRLGKPPYPAILLNVHKLIGLAAGVLLVVTASQIHQTAPLASLEIAAVGVAVLFFVCTIITGGLVSLTRPIPAAIQLVHKLFPYLTTLSSAAALYLLLGAE